MRKKELSPTERRELEELAAMPDEKIDTRDIPEAPAENWAFARRGAFYRPIKQPVNIRIDADVLDWFKSRAEGRGYQTEINRVLRRHVMEHAMNHVVEKEKQR
ncbi:MAG: BrnA antitoxin family protein [Methylocystis sp.]|uniref:BrnA antitoxin family protein n=1 Tax=Methylocystis sp. TaxID=1911079 RepID=UPI00394AE363